MLTQTYSYHCDPFKMADTYSIINKAIYNVEISNVRLLNGKLWADIVYKDDNKTTVNGSIASFNSGTSTRNGADISKIVATPVDFFTHFDWLDKHPTDLEFTFTVDKAAEDAPKEVKDFYANKLNADAVKGFWTEIEKELNKRKNDDKKIEGELKETLIKKIIRSFHFDKGTQLLKAILISLALAVILAVPFVFASSIAVALNVSILSVFATATLAMLCVPFVYNNIANRPDKQEANAMKKLGELDNESVDTTEGRKHLVTKLEKLVSVDPEHAEEFRTSCENALDIGQKSANSYLEQFKSNFIKNANQAAYYIGKEMAAAKKAPAKP
jgi:hypothetical protein